MRAITLTQPWCGLMAAGIKRIENRTRPLIRREMIGQDIAFHASREIDEGVYERIDELSPGLCRAYTGSTPAIGDWWHLSRTTSAVTHVATLVDVLTIDNNDDADDDHRGREFDQALARGTVTEDQWRWYFGRVGYVFNNERVLQAPVPCRGWQGSWTLPRDIETKVREQLEARAA
jgi:hypothetical protein